MDKEKTLEKITEIVRLFGTANNPKKTLINKEVKEKTEEVLDYLRVCVKYNFFDLEATKRENQYLRHVLEEKTE